MATVSKNEIIKKMEAMKDGSASVFIWARLLELERWSLSSILHTNRRGKRDTWCGGGMMHCKQRLKPHFYPQTKQRA